MEVFFESSKHIVCVSVRVCVCVPAVALMLTCTDVQMQTSIFANKSRLCEPTKPIAAGHADDLERHHVSLLTTDGGNISYVKNNICSVASCGITCDMSKALAAGMMIMGVNYLSLRKY